MKLKQIKYSKCPQCKKHGLKIYKTSYKYNPVIICNCCGKKFKVNRFLSLVVLLVDAVFVGVVYRYINYNIIHIPIEISYIVGIVIWFLFQYFAPLEEYDDSNLNR